MVVQFPNQTHMAAAQAHWRAGRFEAAAEAFQRAAAADPADAGARFDLATVLRVLGRLDESVERYRSVDKTPLRLRALAQIAGIRPARITAAEQAELKADQTAESQFALGLLLERQGDYDAAFAALSAGNRLQRATFPVPPAQAAARHAAVIAELKATFTADFIARHQGQGNASAAPIFVVGMPRSGSTLIEQILASHRDVTGFGEAETIPRLAAGRFPFPRTAPMGTGHFRVFGGDYLNTIGAMGWDGQGRFVDKTLANDVAVGLIHLMLPDAVILHSVRDAADTCLSCFRQRFAYGNQTMYDLADIGHRYRRYRQTMDHWAQVLPGRVIDISNEALIADFEPQTRALLEACGLDWDAACLRFHETKRAVNTASMVQVRSPINAGSVQQWRRYERHLGPLFEALGPYAPA
ncbi:MAG: putative repeat protein [Caulobacter sp.]|nr:putative repeat protein [Caulobacter sp.]